jgi:hypothetical protein
MAKKRKSTAKPKLSSGSFGSFKQTFSFDPESVTFMSVLGWMIRKEIEQTSLDMSENKMCVPKDTIIKAIKKIGLGNWVSKVEKSIADSIIEDAREELANKK